MNVSRFLLVDDSEADRLLITRSLQARYRDLEIRESVRAEDAIKQVASNPPDCMVLDIHLPGKTGIELIQQLKNENGGMLPCAVVAMTGSGSDHVAVEALKAGAHDYVPKSRVNEAAIWDAVLYSCSRFMLQREMREREEQLRRLNQELQRKDRIKTQFVANASHELRTPVAAMTGLVGLLEQTGLTDEQKKLLGNVRSCCDGLLMVVDDLIDLTKIESGDLQLHARPFSVGECVQHALESVTVLAQDKGLELVREIDPQIPASLLGDPSRLRQIIFNLVGNAIKFSSAGTVSVNVKALSLDPLKVRFEVKDEGSGISLAEQKRLFEPHFQTGSVDEKSKGSGLGLAIVRSLVNRMQGQVGVISQPGQGSLFWFEIPLEVATGSEAPLPKEAPAVESSVRIFNLLVAEDNPIAAQVLALQLRRLGHKVDLVADGQFALESAQKGGYDAIIMDCQMPRMDGFEATRKLRETFSPEELPIFALTANTLLGESSRCRAAGMNDYLVKPVPVTEIQRLLETWLPTAS